MRAGAATGVLFAIVAAAFPVAAHSAVPWSGAQAISPYGYHSPVVAVDSAGNAAATYVGPKYLAVTTRTAGGRFAPPIGLAMGPTNPAGTFAPQDQQVGLSPSGYLAVGASVLDGKGGHAEVFVRPPGGVFGAPTMLPAFRGWKLAVGGDGTVAVMYPDAGSQMVSVRAPGAAGFGPFRKVTPTGRPTDPAQLVVSGSGAVGVFWPIGPGGFEYAESASGAASFTHHLIEHPSERPGSAVLATSPGGVVAVMLQSFSWATESYTARLALRAPGQAFSVSEVPSDGYWRSMAVNDSGAVVATGSSPGDLATIRTLSRAADGAVSLTATPRQVPPTDFVQTGIDAAGDATLAWRAGVEMKWGFQSQERLFSADLPSRATSLSAIEERTGPTTKAIAMQVAPSGSALLAWDQFSADFVGPGCVWVAGRDLRRPAGPDPTDCARVPAPVDYRALQAPVRAPRVRLRVSVPARQRLSQRGVQLRATCSVSCRLVGRGSVRVARVRGSRRFRVVRTPRVKARRRVNLRLRLSRRDHARIRRSLRARRRVTARIRVTATDGSRPGRSTVRTVRLRLPR